MSLVPGTRCRSTHTIALPDGVVRRAAAAALVAGLLLASAAGAATFSAREEHRGLVVDRDGSPAGLLAAGGWFRRPGEPNYVYHDGGKVVAAVWDTGPDAAVVRGGKTSDAPLIGKIVPSWKDGQLELTIQPANGAAFRTGLFQRASGGGALNRGTSTWEALAGNYRATITAADGTTAGWMTLDVEPDGGTKFTGDLPPAIPLPLAAAAAAAVEGEVNYIYSNVVDRGPRGR